MDASNISDADKRYGLAKKAALRIIRLYGLNETIQDCFTEKANEIFSFPQDDNTMAYVAINSKKKSIVLGYDKENILDLIS